MANTTERRIDERRPQIHSPVFQLPRFSSKPFQNGQGNAKISISSESACSPVCTWPGFILQETGFNGMTGQGWSRIGIALWLWDASGFYWQKPRSGLSEVCRIKEEFAFGVIPFLFTSLSPSCCLLSSINSGHSEAKQYLKNNVEFTHTFVIVDSSYWILKEINLELREIKANQRIG